MGGQYEHRIEFDRGRNGVEGSVPIGRHAFIDAQGENGKGVLPSVGIPEWSAPTMVLTALIVVVLCGGMLLDKMGVLSIYATPGQLVIQSASGEAPVGADGKTRYYAVDHKGNILLDSDGLPATTNSVSGAVVGLWKGGTARSNHMEGDTHIVDEDPNTYASPFKHASISIDRKKVAYFSTDQFEWGQGAFDGGRRVFQWASTAHDEIDSSVSRENGDIVGLQWRRAGSGEVERVSAEAAETNAENAITHEENAIVFTGALKAGIDSTFGSSDTGGDGYVVRVRFPDAALLNRGEEVADLILTYRAISLKSDKDFNMQNASGGSTAIGGKTAALGLLRGGDIVVEGRYGQIDESAEVSTDGDSWVWDIGSAYDDLREDGSREGSANKPSSLSIGVRGVCELSVVKSGGNADSPSDRIKGTLVFSMRDIDTTWDVPFAGRSLSSDGGIGLGNPLTYSESVLVYDGAKSYALIPEGNLLTMAGEGVEGLANGLRFNATISDSSTFDSGFSVLADTEGFVFEWICCGGSSSAGIGVFLGL
ncbi:MAG: hypothetical protein IJ131_10150 [Eggerthellaceae bacterium]|nr:hypothetical protein [Eggerthellaceae bacterium]